MVRVGELDVQIQIRRWSWIKGAAAGLREVQTDSWTLWAKVEDKPGRPNTDNGQMTWTVTTLMTCYFERDRMIALNDTVDYDGQRYLINDIRILTQGNRQMAELSCSATGGALIDNLNAMWQTVNYTGTGGEGVKTSLNILINKVIHMAFKDGVEFKVIDESGVLDPDQKQVQWAPSGRQEWTVPFVANENALFVYSNV